MTSLTWTLVSHYVLSNSVVEEYKVQLIHTHRVAQTWKKLLVARDGTKLYIFYGIPVSILLSQRPAIGTFYKPDHTTHCQTYFNITLSFLILVFPFRFLTKTLYAFLTPPRPAVSYTFPLQKSSFTWGLQIVDLLIIRLSTADTVSTNNRHFSYTVLELTLLFVGMVLINYTSLNQLRRAG